MKTLSLFFHAFGDLAMHVLPMRTLMRPRYAFGFLVHPRNESDVFRKFPILRIVPPAWLERILSAFWPITVSRITGLTDREDRPIDGFVFSVPLTSRMLLEDRSRAQRKILAALRLARKKGVHLVGLGGLISSVTGGGLTILPEVRDMAITTGHAYTAVNVTNNVFALVEYFHIDPKKVRVAIVGAAGSIGTSSALILARAGYARLLLVDLARKREQFESLARTLEDAGATDVVLSHQIRDIKDCDIIIAATNAPEALIVASDLKPGAIVVDDAQPSDVAADVLERDDVLAIEAGVVRTPGISMNFDMGLKHREDLFCCLAEVLILASEKQREHYVVHRATLAHVDEIKARGDALGFTIAPFQNRKERISNARLESLRGVISHNGIQL